MRTKNEKVKDDKHRMDGTRVVHKAVASRDDRWFDRINTAFLIGVVLVIGYPLWFVLIASISDPQAVESGKVWIWPVDFTIDGYLRVFAENSIWIGYRNTIVYTLVGVALHLSLVLPCAYALSRQYMAGRTAVTWYILFTMLFSGGIVPTYLVVKDLGMLDTSGRWSSRERRVRGRSSWDGPSSNRLCPTNSPNQRKSTAPAISRFSFGSRSRSPRRSSRRWPYFTASGYGTNISRPSSISRSGTNLRCSWCCESFWSSPRRRRREKRAQPIHLSKSSVWHHSSNTP